MPQHYYQDDVLDKLERPRVYRAARMMARTRQYIPASTSSQIECQAGLSRLFTTFPPALASLTALVLRIFPVLFDPPPLYDKNLTCAPRRLLVPAG